MVLDDSDSSDGDDTYKATNVLLGYASKEPVEDTFSQLGGKPTWPSSDSSPSSVLARCKCCNGMMPLLLQLYADLPTQFPGHERRLYVFNCKRKACRRKDGSFRALRGTKLPAKTQKQRDESKGQAQDKMDQTQRAEQQQNAMSKKPEPTSTLGDSVFGPGFKAAGETRQNPFAMQDPSKSDQASNENDLHAPVNPLAPAVTRASTSSPAIMTAPSSEKLVPVSRTPASPHSVQQMDPHHLASTFAEKARIDSSTPSLPHSIPTPKAPWPDNDNDLPTPYPSYHLDADYETLDHSSTSPGKPSSSTSAMEIDPSDSANDVFDKEAFESTLDKTFQKFADRVAQNPDQVLRYEYDGQPLLYSITDRVGQLLHHHQTERSLDGSRGVKTVSATGMSSKAKGLPKCTNCGAGRVFELQLMPEAIAQLEAEEVGLDGMDWGTVLVGVCGKDCGGEVERGQEGGGGGGGGAEEGWGWVEEWCGVQWEEIVKPSGR